MLTETKKEKIDSVISHAPLKESNGVYLFITTNESDASSSAEQAIDFRNRIKKKFPKFYELAKAFINMPIIFERGMGRKEVLREVYSGRANVEKTIINLGSGVNREENDIINVDCFHYSGVNVVADVRNLPFKDGSADAVFSVSLLEHVPESEKALAEIIRILKPGGYFYCAVPFMYPFHSAPDDYARFTLKWFSTRMEQFEFIRSGADSGPITAITILMAYAGASIFSFGSRSLYSGVRDFFIILLVPFRALDILFARLPFAEDTAASIYFFARKK